MDLISLYFTCSLLLFYRAYCLDNGVALKPPMGWLSWGRFHCNTKCEKDPSVCISENLFIDMADKLISGGYKDVGYEFVNIDDCWMEKERDRNGDMVADYKRFPSGIKFLSKYMHSKGLKLGIYHDYGDLSCMRYPGLKGHMNEDAKKFAEWGIDMIKLDGCYSKVFELEYGFTSFGKLLRQYSNRTILYSCSWPYYEFISGIQPDYKKISQSCNMFRTYHDIQNAWKSIEEIIDFFGDNQEVFADAIHPGSFSDPDMLMIGNGNLTPGQSRAQMAVWVMIPAPLLMSNDLRAISDEAKKILLNKRAIYINQDILGKPGKVIYKENKVEIWKRPISPIDRREVLYYSHALLFLNRQKNQLFTATFSLNEFGLLNKKGYAITDVFNDRYLGVYNSSIILNISVLPLDVIMLHCMII